MRIRGSLLAVALLAALTSLSDAPVEAGCGCNKPPPPLAPIRPAFGSPGDMVTLFATGLVPGQAYTVTFTSGTRAVAVPGVAVLRRDFADGVAKPQVTVPVPTLPLGPAAVTVTSATAIAGTLTAAAPLLALPAAAFTALPPAMALTEDNGETVFYCYRGAVGADGTTYIPLNVGAISQHIVFKGFGQAYPIMFSAADLAIYNTQGVLMQLLTADNQAIWSVADDKGTDNSFSLVYDRHEFQTYKDAHVHVGELLLDPDDPAWHLDGTRHIDHDNLVIAVHAKLRTGSYPVGGATKSFNLDITTALDTGTASGKTLRNVDFCH